MNDAEHRYPTEEHQRFAADTRRGAVAVANILDGWLDIQTVLDLGCGTGIWLNVLRDGGRRQVFGVDFERNDPADLAVDSDLILTADLGQKLDLHRRYDLVVCLEVAEHIDAQFADVVVDNCIRHADLILFSAALPGQQGVNHINEQLPQYWAERFRRRGYIVLDLIRPLIWDEPQIPVWYRQNILLFVRNGSTLDETLRARAAVAASGPLDVAHPEYMRWFSCQAQTATAEVQAAEVEVQTAKAEVQTAKAEVQTAKAEVQTAKAEVQTAKAEVQTAKAEVQIAKAEVQTAKAEAQTARVEAQTAKAEAQTARVEAQTAKAEAQTARVEAQTAAAEAEHLRAKMGQLQHDLEAEKSAHDTAHRAHDLVLAEIANVRAEIANLHWERAVILGSTLWRAMEPLRRLGRTISPSRRQQMRHLVRALIPRRRRSASVTDHSVDQRGGESSPLPIESHVETASASSATLDPESSADQRGGESSPLPTESHVETASASSATLDPESSAAAMPTDRILFISGEAHTPGHIYRVMRHVEAAAQLGMAASWMPIDQVWERGEEISAADIVIIWRAEDSPAVSTIFSRTRAGRAKVLFDIDDLMFKPELATVSVIDGIRSLGHDPASVAAMFQRIQGVAMQAHACICTTEELAHQMREFNPTTFVLPNGFDAATLDASRIAVRRRGRDSGGVVRLGYATGTRTHQADFRIAVDAVGRILRERPQCRLVLFRDPAYQTAIVDPAEFPALTELHEQIEWRDAVSLSDLPNELVRFDINLAPLEVGNPFCEAKSELKFFEAALVDVCTIASPTAPMRRVIRDGETGRLAASADAWYAAMLELVDDPTLRRRLAHGAYLDVLWQFGPQRRMAALSSILQQMEGAERGALAFELNLRRRADAARPEFDIPEAEQIFISDQDDSAEVTVIIPVYNYARYVVEALDSVLRQTLTLIDLVVVDDESTDDSLAVVTDWARRHANRFNRLVVMRNRRNSGLARARNVGFDAAETPFVLPLDADNRLRPECCAKCLAALRMSRAAFAYPSLQCFGYADHLTGTDPFSAIRFAAGNYIDAMALVAKWAWAAVGGYAHIPYGWEDYDFWCRCIEQGFWGQQVPEILAEYRLHGGSMLHTATDIPANKLRVIEQLKARHAWLSIPYNG